MPLSGDESSQEVINDIVEEDLSNNELPGVEEDSEPAQEKSDDAEPTKEPVADEILEENTESSDDQDQSDTSSARRSTRSAVTISPEATLGKTAASVKRSSSRLQDPERAAKHKAFLQKVTVATNGTMESFLEQEAKVEPQVPPLKRKISSSPVGNAESKRRRSSRNNSSGQDVTNDCYCWICHKEGEVICCETCPRVFHLKCMQLEQAPTEDWVCPECVLIMTAENMDTRSRAMRLLNVDQLCTLLRHALTRMRSISGIEPFLKPVDLTFFPAYKDYITCPMDLSAIERNIKRKQYGSTEAFLADTKWVLHNCIIFNSLSSKLTSVAKSLVKICKHEMQEIENCPDCYMNAHTKKDSWFIVPCRVPHLVVWAKLKGFPFWPGKAMRVNGDESVDVRFFGVHDRAWIPLKDVYLYSEEPPVHLKNKKKGNLESCVDEVELYVKNITEKFGTFQHAPPKTPLDPKREEEQIRILYPKCTLPFDLGPARRRTRTYSFSGSERSHSGTPTPSESDNTDDHSAPTQSQTILPPPDLTEPNKMEEDHKAISEEMEETKENANDSSEQGAKDSSIDEKMKSEVPQKPVDPKKQDLVSEEVTKRSAVSPPCEVSSTTQEERDKKRKANLAQPTLAPAAEVKTVVKEVAIIAETSETVELEGEINDDENELILDEEEIDDDEEPMDTSGVEETKEQGTAKEKSSPPPEVEKVVSKIKEPVDPTKDGSPGGEKAKADKSEPKEKDPSVTPSQDSEVGETKSPESLEIDDVEPEQILDDDDEAVDPSSLFGSGISISVVGKKVVVKPPPLPPAPTPPVPEAAPVVPISSEPIPVKEKPAEHPKSPAPVPADISIGSGISVTVVPKKKSATPTPPLISTPGPTPSSLSTSSSTVTASSNVPDEATIKKIPRISVKKESELMGTAVTKDIVNVQSNVGSTRSRNTFPRKSTDSHEGEDRSSSKNPPDPIVTISKVQSLVGKDKSMAPAVPESSMSLLKSSVNNIGHQKASNHSSRSHMPPISSPHVVGPPPPPSSTPGHMPKTSMPPSSLASILGAPRINGPPYHRNGPGNMSMSHPMQSRPGGVPPHASSLLRMGGPPMPNSYRGPHPVGPMGMPSLHPRPPSGPLSAPPNIPPNAGPVSEQLHKVATKLVDYMRGSLEDLFRELASKGSHEAHIKSLQLELEKMQWRHQQEMAEVKHNADLILLELRQSMESEKQKTLGDIRKQAEIEKQKSIAETKKKQWCANCGKEAIFYCCWNTSYCDYPCQQSHWPSHMTTCAQNQSNQDEESTTDAPDHPSGMDSHFLSGGSNGPPTSGRNAMPITSRGMQSGPSMMSMGSMGINPRLMSQMGLRFPHGGPPPPPRGMGGVRFPGNYFM